MCAFLFSFPRIHSGWLNWSQFSADIVVPSGPQPDTSVAQVSIVLNLCFSPLSHSGCGCTRGSVCCCFHWASSSDPQIHALTFISLADMDTLPILWCHFGLRKSENYFIFVQTHSTFFCKLTSNDLVARNSNWVAALTSRKEWSFGCNIN